MSKPNGWRSGVVYQIYPRSFCDSNGDGIGDLPGIISKLDYLQTLGAEVIWLSPIYASPNDDNGYDISDYRAIMAEFGTMADFDALLAGMHQRGLKLMMDLVVNHSSDEHDWFRQARSSRDNPYHDYYIWAEPVDGREPNNWESVFNGSAWAWNEATSEYYLHMFSAKQPDLNWENPKLREEVWALMRFWLDKGVDGFRMDVINLISKHRGADGRLPDAPACRPGFLQPAWDMSANGPRLLAYLQEMKREVLQHYDCLTVGETPGADPILARALTDRDTGPLHMLFQFEHMGLDSQPGRDKWALAPLHLPDLKHCLNRWQQELAGHGWNSLYFCNHDQPRSVSRYGDDGRWRVESAKMLATCLHGQQGTPYVYQGEELGMTNYPFRAVEECQDLEIRNMYREALRAGAEPEALMQAIRAKGRDNARTPMQWSAADGAGFSSGRPWLALNPNHREINAGQALADPDSVFHYYRRLIALRRERPALVEGSFELLEAGHTQLFAYRRSGSAEHLLVLASFSPEPVALPAGLAALLAGAELLLSNWPPRGEAQALLRPFEAGIYRLA